MSTSIGIGIGIPFFSSSGYWTPQTLGTKILFWGKVSETAGGQMPNKVSGSTDFLTATGSPLAFQAPNTAPYIAADTDYIWFRTDEFQRTVTTAELIGYDLQRTPVKYLDDSPNTIEEIIILADGAVLTDEERDSLFSYMHLPYLWDDSWNDYGYEKYNRGMSQILWPVEVETVLHDTFTAADTTNLNAHALNVGPAAWTIVSGVWTISSNRAIEATQAGAVYIATVDAGKSNFDASLSMLTPDTAIKKFVNGLFFRYQDSTHSWLLHLYLDVTVPTFELTLDGVVKNTVAAGSYQSMMRTLRVVTNGNNIKCYLDGVLKIEVDDATYNTQTKLGIRTYRAPAYYDTPRDNFIVYSPYV